MPIFCVGLLPWACGVRIQYASAPGSQSALKLNLFEPPAWGLHFCGKV